MKKKRSVFQELLTIFRGDSPMTQITDRFAKMLKIAQEMVLDASDLFWQGAGHDEQRRRALYQRDIKVNKLERKVRRLVTTHLSVHGIRDVPYGLLMMSLVKDVERIGDYAKNLVDIADLLPTPWPESPLVEELRELREAVHRLTEAAADVFLQSDAARAQQLIQEGRVVSRRCDDLVGKVARSELSAAAAVKISVGARYYKRIVGHFLNLLTSVIMPLDKLDYFDEDLLPGTEADYAGDQGSDEVEA